MELTKIVQTVNRLLAGEQLMYSELEVYLDQVIDDINAKLDSAFPAFSEFNSTDYPDYPNYNLFPEKYLRTVVCVGAADKFYTQDSEGMLTSPTFHEGYLSSLFYMERDFISQVPDEYQGAAYQGVLGLGELDQDRGLEIDGDL